VLSYPVHENHEHKKANPEEGCHNGEGAGVPDVQEEAEKVSLSSLKKRRLVGMLVFSSGT